MPACNSCGERMSSAESGKLCSLCVAKMVNYMEGDYHDEDDPAVRHLKAGAGGASSAKSSPQNGCAVVVLTLLSVPAVLAAAGIGLATLIG